MNAVSVYLEFFNKNIYDISDVISIYEEIKNSELLNNLPDDHEFWKEYSSFMLIINNALDNKYEDMIEIKKELTEQLDSILEIKKKEEQTANNNVVNF